MDILNIESDEGIFRFRRIIVGVLADLVKSCIEVILLPYLITKLGMVKTEAKTNPDVKGNPTLKNYLENVNAEIRRTHNTLMEVIESLKARNVPYTADVVKEELVMKLKPDIIRPVFNIPRDLIGYMTYYIGLCEDGTIQSAGGTKLGAGTIRAYYGTLAALRKF